MNDSEAYKSALNYIYSFLDFSLTHQAQIAPERFELERMFDFLAKLGNPQETYPSIHIAGTKGKGSVASHCAAALQAAGYKTGLYTSPHLHDFRERIQVNGEMISMSAFAEVVSQLKPAVETTPGLTSYELQTAIAFVFFAEQKVDCAVLEVGMGGRLDSTNVVTPLVSVITSISYDHMHVLGDTLADIAGEKGGIIKPGVPVVSSPQVPEALNVLENIANDKDAPFHLVGRDFPYQIKDRRLSGQSFQVMVDETPIEFETGLLGDHQVENAVTAYAALIQAQASGLVVDDEAVRRGFNQIRWPGRFEVVNERPAVVFDGAHNRDSARRLIRTAETYFPGKPITLVFGAMEDKDIAGMFEELLPKCKRVIFTSADHPRAAKLAVLKNLAQTYPVPHELIRDVDQVIQLAIHLAGEDGLVIFTGSLSVVGDFRSLWYKKCSENGYN